MARAADGRVVFIPRTAPGELVEAQFTEEHKQWLRGGLLRVLEASPARREAPCPYYARCGGCQLQHIGYDAQLSAKASVIAESLRRIGGFDAPDVEVVPSEHELGYRNRISLILKRSADGFIAGYHAYDDAAEVVGIESCPIAEPAINDVLSSLLELWRHEPRALPRGEESRLTFRTNAEGEVCLAIEPVRGRVRPAARGPGGAGASGGPRRERGASAGRAKPSPKGERGASDDAGGRGADGRAGGEGTGSGAAPGLAGSVPGLVALWRMDLHGRIVGREGARALVEQVGPYKIALEGTAFLQVNREAAARLDAYVREQCGPVHGARVIDAYCGHGIRAVDMAREGADVTGIDTDRGAIKAGGRLAAETGAPVRLLAAEVERSLRRELPADVAILNPPRRGVTKPVTDALSAIPAERVIYVSCNPATLARDLKRLASSYDISAVRAFDLFPQTAHVETVATLKRRVR